ncbi:LLM class flavin-dependent oxidoreductase [Oerskovia flava]|uniref:LLM class flavin-dependent oxidoreductase n=1 Tax=Oerskovia flava TaxID=2986422 RepID=UPI0022403B05|nr:LLM class flavin-dependent oxidoreductase [Oerskovia sp. JB1-3-2]
MVRLGYGLPCVHPAEEMVGLIRAADRLGFHFCHLNDDASGLDPWSVLAAAARETSTIRLGVSATHVYLREPTLVAQALATLDQLSGGRAQAVVSFGVPQMLDAYHVGWRGTRPLARVREAIGVMRAYLDDGSVDQQGEFFRYSGVRTMARPVQEHLPLFVGGLGGPRSFELAGEVADGIECGSSSRENSEYVAQHVRAGAARAGRDPGTLRLGASVLSAVGDDAAVAKEAAGAVAAAWLPTYPAPMLARHGLEAGLDHGRRATAGEALTIAGTPEQCAERIRTDLVDAGIDHVLLALVDPTLVEIVTGTRPAGLPDAREQLRLVHDRVFPAFADAGPG